MTIQMNIQQKIIILSLLMLISGPTTAATSGLSVAPTSAITNPIKNSTEKSDIIITADTFELDADKQEVKAIGHVIATQEDMKLYGDKAIFDKNKEKIHITGNVKMTKEKLTLLTDEVMAYSLKRQVIAKRNVRFDYDKSILGTAGQAVFFLDKNLIVLDKNPKVTQNNNHLSGDQITIDLTEEKIKTKGKAKIIISNELLQSGVNE